MIKFLLENIKKKLNNFNEFELHINEMHLFIHLLLMRLFIMS